MNDKNTREILFRGKHIHAIKANEYLDGTWVYGYLANERYINSEKLEAELLVDTETVGQYTGLKDKNGTKIFEGDIVKTHYANAKRADFIESVVFHNGKFCAQTHESEWSYQWCPLADGVKHVTFDKSVYMEYCEVIGNIYDNPELLEETK